MRTNVWIITIAILISLSPVKAETTNSQIDFLLDEALQKNNLIDSSIEANAIEPPTNIQRLSLGQAVSIITGSVIGYRISNSLLRYVIGRYANTADLVTFNMMGIMFGGIFGGKWCDARWWPC